jgi:hypothetical protein
MSKGDYSHKFNPGKLRSLIQEGKTAKEIMDELKISKFTLQEQVLMLQNRDRKVYEVKGLVAEPAEEKKRRLMARKEGIVFSKEMLEKTGFHPGEAFEMQVEGDKIILTKLKEEK